MEEGGRENRQSEVDDVERNYFGRHWIDNHSKYAASAGPYLCNFYATATSTLSAPNTENTINNPTGGWLKGCKEGCALCFFSVRSLFLPPNPLPPPPLSPSPTHFLLSPFPRKQSLHCLSSRQQFSLEIIFVRAKSEWSGCLKINITKTVELSTLKANGELMSMSNSN